MHLGQFDTVAGANEGFKLELFLPTGKPVIDEKTGKQWWIQLLGVDSKVYQEATHKSGNKKLARRARPGGRKQFTTMEEVDDDQLELLIAVTVGWCPELAMDASGPTPYSKENARILYTRFPWVREQCEDAVMDRSNVLGESSKNSRSSPSTAST